MARNVEIKARAVDLDRMRRDLAALAPDPPLTVRQRDTFFYVPDGRLKLREQDDGTAELIFYERLDQTGPKLSAFLRSPCSDARATAGVLAAALGERGVVEKRREIYRVDATRVHLDEVRGLGTYLELEVVLRHDQPVEEGRRVAAELLEALRVPEAALVSGAYIDLLETGAAVAAGSKSPVESCTRPN